MAKKASKTEGNSLDDMRKTINDIDVSLVNLLDERSELVKEIGEYKKANDIPIYQPGREKNVKERILKTSKKVFPTDALMHIFTEIVSAARSLEEPMNVGFLGPEGTFTEQAAVKHFGSSVIFSPVQTISDVFRQVENGKLHYGVVPIENTLGGTVNITLDEFIDSSLYIVGENYLNIHQNLLANVDDLSDIKRVYSHPQGFAQSRAWIEINLPSVEKLEVSSTAKAASLVPWDKFSAAIASEIAAERYGLNILERNIEDNPQNFSRFWIISTKENTPDNAEKTTVLVSVKNKPGALLRLLSPFQVYGLNLTKIESRPSRQKPWDYLFFIDVDDNADSAPLKKALDKVREDAAFLKVIGSYAKGSY